MFVDQVKIYARAGHGGKGCVAFHREAFITKGGPSGGNGGRGGDVILEADHDLNNLIAQYYQPRLIAEDGKPGLGKGMDGHAGKDLLVKVPCGTLVWKLPSTGPLEAPGASESDKEIEPPRFGSGERSLIRHAGRERAFEMDWSQEAPAKSQTANLKENAELRIDLT